MLRITILLSMVALVSCSTQKKLTKNFHKKQVTVKKITLPTNPLIEENLNDCRDCIAGSSQDKELHNGLTQKYYLSGADELNLTNKYFDIPVTYNKATRKWIKFFTTKGGRKSFKRYAERSGRYAKVFSKILKENKMPRDLIYLSMAESGFQNHARSWAKAVGPWQFMPFTGRKFGLDVGFFVDERRDPLKATQAAADYLKLLHGMFGSWELAMAGYNAGEGKIQRAIKRYRTKNFWQIRKGRYLKSETKNYVPKIMALAIIGKNLSRFGFSDINFHRDLDFEKITVPGNTDLYKLGQVLGLSFKDLKKYNPEIVRWQVPPHLAKYSLRVPKGYKKAWIPASHKKIVNATTYKTYRTRGKSSLKSISRKFKVPVKVLSKLNDIPKTRRLLPKTMIYLPFRSDHSIKNKLYADLYEKPRKSVVRRRRYNRWIKRGYRNGKVIRNPKKFYVVKKGDNLWNISRRTGVAINTIIRSNYKLIKRRMILPGDKLAIK